MDESQLSWTLAEIADIVGGELNGPADLRILRPVPAGDDDPSGITFAETEEYLLAVEKSQVGAVIVKADEREPTKPHIRCQMPREAFGRILAMSWRDLPIQEGIHSTAIVSASAEIDPSACIGAYAVIEEKASIGPGVKIYPFCYVGTNCRLEDGAKLYPHVVLYENVRIGERTVIHSGTVLGADGFGYFWDGNRHRKVPQAGGVSIGDDCEVGALTAIDRATAGETRLGNGVKIDNLVQIAHNVEIGSDSVVVALTGISGSSKLGKRNTIGGQSGLKDHVRLGDDVVLGARTGVMGDVPEPGYYWGQGARPAAREKRLQVHIEKLPELVKRLKELEAKVASLLENAD